jgi:prolyl oligopeptidase
VNLNLPFGLRYRRPTAEYPAGASIAAGDPVVSLTNHQRERFSGLDSDEKIPYVQKIGAHYYNFWQDAAEPARPVAAHHAGRVPQGRAGVGDRARPRCAGQGEGENWVWHGADCLKPSPNTAERCLIALSRGGADADVTREFDLANKDFVKDGFFLPRPRAGSAGSTATRVRLHRFRQGLDDHLRLPAHRQGVEARHAAERGPKVVFEGRDVGHLGYGAYRDHTRASSATSSTGLTFYTNEAFLRARTASSPRSTSPTAPTPCTPRMAADRAARAWTVGGKTYAAARCWPSKLDDFLAGKRDFDVLFDAHRHALAGRLRSPRANHCCSICSTT